MLKWRVGDIYISDYKEFLDKNKLKNINYKIDKTKKQKRID